MQRCDNTDQTGEQILCTSERNFVTAHISIRPHLVVDLYFIILRDGQFIQRPTRHCWYVSTSITQP